MVEWTHPADLSTTAAPEEQYLGSTGTAHATLTTAPPAPTQPPVSPFSPLRTSHGPTTPNWLGTVSERAQNGNQDVAQSALTTGKQLLGNMPQGATPKSQLAADHPSDPNGPFAGAISIPIDIGIYPLDYSRDFEPGEFVPDVFRDTNDTRIWEVSGYVELIPGAQLTPRVQLTDFGMQLRDRLKRIRENASGWDSPGRLPPLSPAQQAAEEAYHQANRARAEFVRSKSNETNPATVLFAGVKFREEAIELYLHYQYEQRGVVAYDEYRQHVYETYGEWAAEEARYIFNPALAPPSWRESAAWAFDEIALGTGVYALEEAIIAMRSISKLRQAGATARLAATDLAHNRPVQLQLLAPAGGVAPRALPKLTAGTEREMLGEAIGHVKSLPRNAAQRAEAFEGLAKQITERHPHWNAGRGVGSDGSTTFLGRQGEGLVVRPDGRLYRGSLGNGIDITPNGVTPNYDVLKPLD